MMALIDLVKPGFLIYLNAAFLPTARRPPQQPRLQSPTAQATGRKLFFQALFSYRHFFSRKRQFKREFKSNLIMLQIVAHNTDIALQSLTTIVANRTHRGAYTRLIHAAEIDLSTFLLKTIGTRKCVDLRFAGAVVVAIVAHQEVASAPSIFEAFPHALHWRFCRGFQIFWLSAAKDFDLWHLHYGGRDDYFGGRRLCVCNGEKRQ